MLNRLQSCKNQISKTSFFARPYSNQWPGPQSNKTVETRDIFALMLRKDSLASNSKAYEALQDHLSGIGHASITNEDKAERRHQKKYLFHSRIALIHQFPEMQAFAKQHKDANINSETIKLIESTFGHKTEIQGFSIEEIHEINLRSNVMINSDVDPLNYEPKLVAANTKKLDL